MSAHTIVSRFFRTAVAGGLALILPLAAFALDPAPAWSLSVSVFSDRYIAAERQFTDLDALEGWVKSSSPRVIRLDGCGAASATRLLAAVERFQHAYLEIRMSEAGKPGCTPIGAGHSIPTALTQVSAGEREPAVDRYWRNVMP
jgi:hypothetical protein